jgi:hypothetical protein
MLYQKGDIINIIYIPPMSIPLSSHPFPSSGVNHCPLISYLYSTLPHLYYLTPTLPCFCALILPIPHYSWFITHPLISPMKGLLHLFLSPLIALYKHPLASPSVLLHCDIAVPPLPSKYVL